MARRGRGCVAPGCARRDPISGEIGKSIVFAKFVADRKPERDLPAIKHFFKAYATNTQIRHIIDAKEYTDLATNPVFSTKDFRAVPREFRTIVPEYIKDYVSLNQFAA